MDRQKLIEDDAKPLQQVCVFAEGTTSCGEYILPFREGAFASMRTVQPCVVTLQHGPVKPVLCTIGFPWLLVLMCSSFQFNVSTLTILPEFTPNEYMLELHKDKGKEPWEIYAWCVQDIIAKKGGLKKAEYVSVTNKLKYGSLYEKKADKIEFDGKVFTANSEESKKID